MARLPADTGISWPSAIASITWLPEFNVVVFALLLNLPWELVQAPLYREMADAPHWQAVKACSAAAGGDAVIVLIAYWVVAVATHRSWITVPRFGDVVSFVAVGLAVTSGIEWMALHGLWMVEWQYTTAMLVIPGAGIGLSPLLQWTLLPPLVVWFAKRQLAVPRR